jgi:DNA-binding XRE family transcriptional regulator
MSKKPTPHTVLDHFSFERTFAEVISGARQFVVIESAYITVDGIRRFAPAIESVTRRDIPVCMFVQEPEAWGRRDDPSIEPGKRAELQRYEAAVQYARAIGAHVSPRRGTHLKTAVIDGRITISGSLNILSYTKRTEEEMYLWVDAEFARDTMRRRRLNDCGECIWKVQHSANQIVVASDGAMLGRQIRTMRERAGWSQAELALRLNENREMISLIETGKVQPRADLLVRIFDAFDVSVMTVPKDMASMVTKWILSGS